MIPAAQPFPGDGPPPLLGRDRELRELGALVDGAAARGGALVLRGEPGIGKSALLAMAAARARKQGMAVRRAAGAESEAQFAFAALHRLLAPFLDRLGRLPARPRRALETAFGLAEGAPPDIFMIGLAALGLIADAAEDAPVLLVVDDAHWLDRPSAEVLAVVGRRLEPEPAVLLLAERTAVPGPLPAAGLPEMRLGGLDDTAARALLHEAGLHEAGLGEAEVREAGPGLGGEVTERVLSEAAGNPLALIELPRAVARLADAPGRDPLPLTARLESAFAGQLTGLRTDTRTLLLLAALDEAPVPVHQRAARDLLGRTADPAALEPAVAGGLGSVAAGGFEFRHPLIRSAVRQAAPAGERRRAHAVLARVHAVDPDRSVWHAAAAATGPDEEIAARLEEAAARAERRGGIDVTLAALERAAELTPATGIRLRRLTLAAQRAFDVGRPAAGVGLLEQASRLGLSASQRTFVAFILELMRSNHWSGEEGVRDYARAARDLAESGQADLAVSATQWISVRAHFSNLDPQVRRELVTVPARLLPPDDSRRLITSALIDPAGRGAEVLAQLRRRSPLPESNPHALINLGVAAAAAWSPELSLPFLYPAVDLIKHEGRPAQAAQMLNFVAWDELRRGSVRAAEAAADESARLCDETAQPLYAASARVAGVIARGSRGDEEAAEQTLAGAEGLFFAVGAHTLAALVQVARGRLAMAAQRYGEAYLRLARVFDPGDPAYHEFVGGWVLADFADAAFYGDGDREVLGAAVARWSAIADQTGSAYLQVQLRYVDALLADEEVAAERFTRMIAGSAAGWPHYRARAQLAYGSWLRRRRRNAEARAPLREAAETLDALGSAELAEQARRELRASGETIARRTPEAWNQLSPTELQIAQLAASGLSNREIGERLYVSHRTVGTHLYRLFPKLGITTRAELSAAHGPAGRSESDPAR